MIFIQFFICFSFRLDWDKDKPLASQEFQRLGDLDEGRTACGCGYISLPDGTDRLIAAGGKKVKAMDSGIVSNTFSSFEIYDMGM